MLPSEEHDRLVQVIECTVRISTMKGDHAVEQTNHPGRGPQKLGLPDHGFRLVEPAVEGGPIGLSKELPDLFAAVLLALEPGLEVQAGAIADALLALAVGL